MEEHTRFVQRRKEVMLSARKLSSFRKPPLALTDPKARYPGFRQGIRILKVGHVAEKRARPFPIETVMHESVPFKLSDGVIIYSDIFVPAGYTDLASSLRGKIPAIVYWSPYSKRKGQQILDDFPLRAGVPKASVSEMQKWEGPDPAEWIQHGYAIVNPDARGCWSSEGDFEPQGYAEAFDCAELVEWIAEQPWCNGKVGMARNSYLAMIQ